MTATRAGGTDSTAIMVDLSRAQLRSTEVKPPTEEVDEMRRIVRSAGVRSKLLVASVGDLRRFDIWRMPGGAVVHSYVEAEDQPSPCVLATGAAAWRVIAELLSEPASDELAATDGPTTIRLQDVTTLLDSVVNATGETRVRDASVLRTELTGQVLMVARASGARTWWSRVVEGTPIEMSHGRDAQFWAEVIADLTPAAG